MNKLSLLLSNHIYLLLLIIVAFSFAIRVYKVDSVPPSLTWDEAAVGYNAYTIANFGKDEYGKVLPLYFRSFGEDKQPLHIYITALFVKLFGLSEFSTRIAAVIFGSLNVLIIFFLARLLFKSNLIGLISSLFLALSPQNIFFSRFNHEANFALFFFMLGLLLFYRGIKKERGFSPSAFIAFLLSMVSYHAAEIVIPPMILLLFCLYFKEIIKNKFNLLAVVCLSAGFIVISIFNPQLLGRARYDQTVESNVDIEKTEAFKKSHNYLLGKINLTLIQYSWHFGPGYLFISGDKNARLSSQGVGEFYMIDALFLVLGVLYLIKKRSKESILILGWALFGPLPSALFGEAPHAARASFMMGSWQVAAALGFYFLTNFFKKPTLRLTIAAIFIIILLLSFMKFYGNYLIEFPKRYAVDWQYGMKQVVEYVKEHKEYDQIYMTAVRSQPYIFFLYYLKTPLPDYLNSVIYYNGHDQSANNVSYFEKYSFGGWNPFENDANKGVLYILSPSEYDGLRFRSNFDVKRIVYYPNGTTAFFLVALK